VTISNSSAGAWWQVDLGQSTAVKKVVIYNRNDCLVSAESSGCRRRLSNSIVTLRDANDNVLESYRIGDVTDKNEIEIVWSSGCLKFCQSLPNYPLQTAMEVNSKVDSIACTCLYNDGQVPSKEQLPSSAIRSLPLFQLKDSTGQFALGLSPRSNCAADTMDIQTQMMDNSSPWQQFQLTKDGQIVTSACPGKVLTVEKLSGQCTNGAGIQVSALNTVSVVLSYGSNFICHPLTRL
jgi:hypothetical protein